MASINLSRFVGVTTPVEDLAIAIQNQGWQLGSVQYDNKLNAYTAEAISPHGEKLQKTGPDGNTAVANALLAVTRRNHMRTTAQFKVGMWRTNWHERLPEIAEAYRDAPIYDPKAVAAWKALGEDSVHRLHVLGGQLHIEPTNDPAPYATADEMRKDVHEKRHYYLSRAGTSHPVWTSDQVAAFRAVHDILGHGVAGGHYDWPGRNLAAAAHMPLLDPPSQQALFTETVGRQAALQTYGHMPQKITLFPEFVDHHQAEQGGAYRGIHPSQTTAPTSVPKPFALSKTATTTPYWHITRDPNFQINPNQAPTDASSTADASSGPGLMVTQDPHYWASMFHSHPEELGSEYENDDPRGYAAEIDLSGLHPSEYWPSNRGYGDEIWINNPSAARVKRVVSLPEALRISKTAQANVIDVNKGWTSGVDPLPTNAYIHHGDPMEAKATMDNAALIDKGWSQFKRGDGTDDRERMKLAIVNAFRVVLLSPRKDLRWNAIHYQDISHIPGSVDDPKVYWDTLEQSRRRWNEAQGIDPNSHMIYFKFLKPFEARIAAQHPEKGWEWAKDEAKQTLFNWWTEEQERISEEDSIKSPDKQRSADEIERRANEALAKRMQLFLKPKDENTDVEDTQMSMFGAKSKGPTAEEQRYRELMGEGYQYQKPVKVPGGPKPLNIMTGQDSLRYGAFMGAHLKSISQISQHSEDILDAALEDVREHDATGHHFRQQVLSLNVPGVGPKVCSFAWLLLQPLTSQLATIDVHMMDVLGHNYEKEMNNRDYFKFEREFRAGLDAAGYNHLPLGAAQWGMWDYKRTGPGTHQDHSAMAVLDPKPHQDINWAAKAPVTTEFKKNWADSVDWWAATKPYREQVGQEWDDTYGKNFKKNVVPYQDLGNQTMAKIAYGHDFEYYWRKLTPVGSSIESKARSVAEYAKADHMSQDDLEDWLTDHKSDARLSDIEYKRFKKLVLRKWDRLSHVAGLAIDAGPTPIFKHPETGEFHEGMPGQSIMEHVRLSLGLSTQDVWRRLADEHVQKA
jgi:hypothetical protein